MSVCRICLDDSSVERAVESPCNCRAPVHIECLVTWIETKHGAAACEVCLAPYVAGRYGWRTLCLWLAEFFGALVDLIVTRAVPTLCTCDHWACACGGLGGWARHTAALAPVALFFGLLLSAALRAAAPPEAHIDIATCIECVSIFYEAYAVVGLGRWVILPYAARQRIRVGSSAVPVLDWCMLVLYTCSANLLVRAFYRGQRLMLMWFYSVLCARATDYSAVVVVAFARAQRACVCAQLALCK